MNLTNCTFRNKDTKYGYGLKVGNGSGGKVTIDSCTIQGNVSESTEFKGYALLVAGSDMSNCSGQVEIKNTAIETKNMAGSAILFQKIDQNAQIVLDEGNTISGPVKFATIAEPVYKVNIKGGKFDNSDNIPFLNLNVNGTDEEVISRLNVTGGYYKVDISSYINSQYLCQKSTEEEGYPYKVAINEEAAQFYTVVNDSKKYYANLIDAINSKEGVIHVAQNVTLENDDLSALNLAQAVLATDSNTTLTYEGLLSDFLNSLSNGVLENVSLKFKNTESSYITMSNVCAVGGKLTAGQGLTEENYSGYSGVLADHYLFDGSGVGGTGLYNICQESDFIAKIGSLGFRNMQSALFVASQSTEKATVTLLSDINGNIEISTTTSVTLDLNKHTIYGYFAVFAENSTITVENGTIIDDSGSAISTNGLLKNISLELVDLNVTETAENGVAVYAAAGGTTTVTGGVYSGDTGIQICAGSLDVENANITATGENLASDKTNSDGVIPDGSAISIVSRKGYFLLGTVTIAEGSYFSENGKSVNAYTYAPASSGSGSGVIGNLPDDDKKNIIITAGTFSSDVGEYINPGKTQNEDGEVVDVSTASYYFSIFTPESLTINEKYDTNATLMGTAEAENKNVLIKVSVTGPADSAFIMAKDSTGTEYNLAEIGQWGPDSGFLVTKNYKATTPLTVWFTKAGTYTATLQLVTVGEPSEILCECTRTITVKAPSVPSYPSDPAEFPFTDVPSNAWYYNAVKYVFENDLMIGTSDTTFQPKMNLTRAMAAQILYNLEGNPAVTDEATFTDMNTVPNWAKNALAWAQETGVVAGMGNGTFMPNKNVTREQFAQMMYNYAGFKGCDLTAVGDLTQFSDADSISNWAVTALTWANGEGLINGHKDSGQIDPAGTTTRGQAATILMNYDLNLKS